jgi:hypothetical protein
MDLLWVTLGAIQVQMAATLDTVVAVERSLPSVSDHAKRTATPNRLVLPGLNDLLRHLLAGNP